MRYPRTTLALLACLLTTLLAWDCTVAFDGSGTLEVLVDGGFDVTCSAPPPADATAPDVATDGASSPDALDSSPDVTDASSPDVADVADASAPDAAAPSDATALPFAPPCDLVQAIQTGQSLGEGYNASPVLNTTPTPGNVMLSLEAGVLVPAVSPERTISVGTSYPGNICGDDGLTAFAAQLSTFARAAGGTMASAITNVALVGQTMAAVDRDGGTNSYASALAEVATIHSLAAASGRTHCVGPVLVTDGEADVTNYLLSGQYGAYRDHITSDVLALTGQATAPVLLIDQVSSGHRMESQIQQWRAPRDNPPGLNDAGVNVGPMVLVGPKYQWPCGSDGIHLLNALAYTHKAEKAAEVYWRVLRGEDWHPLEPIYVTRVGTTLTIHWHVPNPPIVIEHGETLPLGHQTGSYTVWSQAAGLEYHDDSGDIALSAPVLIAPDTMQVTAAREPQGVTSEGRPWLGYAWTADNAGGHHCGTVDGQHGQIHDSDTTPLNHGVEPNWAVHVQIPTN